MRKSTTAKFESYRAYLRAVADIQETNFQVVGLNCHSDLSKFFTNTCLGKTESNIFWGWRGKNMDIALLHIDIEQIFLQIIPKAKGKQYARPRRSKKNR